MKDLEAPIAGPSSSSSTSHRKVPLALNEWEGVSPSSTSSRSLFWDATDTNRTVVLAGKKGIGLGKRPRAASPSASERLAKMARMAEDRTHTSFRDRARQEYEERRASGRLHPAQRTCATLDEKADIQVRVRRHERLSFSLWLYQFRGWMLTMTFVDTGHSVLDSSTCCG